MGRILFVDDEVLILNSIKRGLRKKDYECYYANSGHEALEILEQVEVDVVFSDMKMPHMNGLELLKAIDQKYPDIVKVILSGYAQLPQLVATINQSNIFKYVGKPWDMKDELIPIIEESLTYAQYKKELAQQKAQLEMKNEAYQKIFKTYNSKAETKTQAWDVMRIYHHVLMKEWQTLVGQPSLDQDILLAATEDYKQLMDHLIHELKKAEIYFEPYRTLKDIAYYLQKNDYLVDFDIADKKSDKMIFEGRGSHVKPLMISLVQRLISKERKVTVKCFTRAKNIGQDKYDLTYYLEGSKEIFNPMDTEDFAFRMYKALLTTFGGDLDIKRGEDRTRFVITCQLYHREEASD